MTAPAERVRARLARVAGLEVAEAMPPGYQRLGRVLLLRLPERLRPHFDEIGRAWTEELGVETVLRVRSGVAGELRVPDVERIAGTGTETEVREHGVRYRLDAARIMFAAGNRTERQRIGRLVRSGEVVIDLFAGIGYFAIPAALPHRASRVYAVEKNPTSFAYLCENVGLNGVAERVTPVLGDNREVALPVGSADRVVLGYLPSAVPWIPRALELLRPDGGTLHLHLVEEVDRGPSGAAATVGERVDRLGFEVHRAEAREVKPYGPGRFHAVVDLEVAARRA